VSDEPDPEARRAELPRPRHPQLPTRPYARRQTAKPSAGSRTLLGGWTYGALYRNSTERTAALDAWPDYYNHRRRPSNPQPQAPDR
jgi:hypothetical protein